MLTVLLGATCAAVVKVVHSTDYSLLIDASTDTTSASQSGGNTVNVDFELTEAHVGHILQVGFELMQETTLQQVCFMIMQM